MNKLFTKIVGACLGLTMAVGVGVAVGNNRKEATPVHAADTTISKTMTEIATANSWVTASGNGTQTCYTSFNLDSNIQISTTGSANCGSYWGSDWRLYQAQGGTFIVTPLNGVTISSIKVTFTISNTGCLATSSGTSKTAYFTSGTAKTGLSISSATTYYVANTGTKTNGQVRITALEIKYAAPATYTVSFAVNTAGYGTVSQSSITNVPSGTSITTSNNTVTINGTTVTATPTANTAQYTYAFTGWSNNTGTVTAARTITANFTRTTNTFTVGGTINNGSLSSTASVAYGSALNITINPNSGHKLPTTLTSVTMGGSAYAGYTYNSGTGAFSIASVTGNVVINATCPVDATTYTISGTITNGSLTGDTGEQVEGVDYIVQISPSALYKYPTSVTVTGAGEEDSGWEYDSSDGTVSIYALGGNVTISATCPAASITSITVSGQKTAFTLGEDFSFGGTVKASYDDVAGSTNVTINTDLVNINSSAYDAFAESNSYTISVALKSNGSVSTSYTVSVTRKSISTTTTYNPVTASKTDWSGDYVFIGGDKEYVMGNTVSSATRVENGSTLPTFTGDNITAGYTDYVYRITKVTGGYTIQNVSNSKYLVGNGTDKQATLVSDISSNNYAVWSISYSTEFVITCNGSSGEYITLRNNTTYGWAIYKAATANVPQLYEKVETPTGTKSLIRITATGPADNTKKEDDILTAADFTVTALYDTAESGTVTQNVSVTSGATLVAGSNTVTLSYTEGGVTKTCQVTVVAAENTAELDGIVWSQANVSRTVFEGAAIGSFGTLEKHFDDDSTIALNLNDCTVAVYNNTSGSKAHDVASPTTYTWNLTNDDGKYLGVTYEGYTLYSGAVSVVESIQPVYGKVETWTFTNQTTSIKAGDKIVIATESEGSGYELSGVTADIGSATAFTTNPSGEYVLDVVSGSEQGSFAFKNGSNYLAYTKDSGTTKNNNLFLIDEVNDYSSWTLSIEDDELVITNVHNTERSLQYNYNNGNPRFCCYTSAQVNPVIYIGVKSYEPTGDDIANTNAVVQKAVLEFANTFNTTMACVNGGTTANVASKWTTLSSDFDDLLDSFSGDNLAHCKALFAGADAVEGGDTLQDMLARYEYICAKYKLDDFLADIDRPPVSQSHTVNPLSNIINGANNATIIAVISLIGITAIGGYFFLHKKKEENY